MVQMVSPIFSNIILRRVRYDILRKLRTLSYMARPKGKVEGKL